MAFNIKKSLEFIAKKRQAYLNHVYNSSSNLNLNQIDSVIDDMPKANTDEKRPLQKTTKQKLDVSHWSRSHSADSDCRSRSRSRSWNKPFNSNRKPIKETLNANENKSKANKIGTVNSEIKNRKKSPSKLKNYRKLAKKMKKNRPLLGYDWALGDLKINLSLN